MTPSPEGNERDDHSPPPPSLPVDSLPHAPASNVEVLQRLVRELFERDEARELRERERDEQKTRASALPLTMGLTTPVSLHYRGRNPLGSTPFGSSRLAMGDGVGARRPLFLPAPIVKAPSPPPAAVEASLPAHGSVAQTVVRGPPPPKVDQPKKFKGTLTERDGAENWLGSAVNWLKISGRDQPEDMRVLMFGGLLEGEAWTWFNTLQHVAEEANMALTVQDVLDKFSENYMGGTVQMMKQLELTSLVYGKGKCVDVVSTQTEFDSLASSLYGSSAYALNPLADQMLVVFFSNIYQKGDIRLWEKAMEMNPVTLEEWKAAVQRAFYMHQVVKEAKKAALRNATQTTVTVSRPFQSTTSTAVTRVHHVDASSVLFSDSEEEGDEDEEGVVPGETIQQMGAGPGKKGTTGTRAGPKEKKRTYADAIRLLTTGGERERLKKKGMCFHCFKKGHMVSECPDANKPARRPTEEELKL